MCLISSCPTPVVPRGHFCLYLSSMLYNMFPSSTGGDLSMCLIAYEAPHERSSPTGLWCSRAKQDPTTIYSCSSTALNSFYVAPAASVGYGNLSSEWHRFRFGCHFFHMTWTKSDNYILFIPYLFHFLQHIKDPSLASLFFLGPWGQ